MNIIGISVLLSEKFLFEKGVILGLDPELSLTAIKFFFGEDDSTLEKHYLHY
jgi:hypothetical protein